MKKTSLLVLGLSLFVSSKSFAQSGSPLAMGTSPSFSDSKTYSKSEASKSTSIVSFSSSSVYNEKGISAAEKKIPVEVDFKKTENGQISNICPTISETLSINGEANIEACGDYSAKIYLKSDARGETYLYQELSIDQ